jgi:hypothetical protein
VIPVGLYLAAAVAPKPTWAGLITAFSTLLLAVGGVITALTVFIPMLRTTRKNSDQLRVIHTLVNSTLTAALQAELDSTRREEMLLRELLSMREDSGAQVSDDQRAALGAVQRKIQELTAAMADRAQQNRAANIQMQRDNA